MSLENSTIVTPKNLIIIAKGGAQGLPAPDFPTGGHPGQAFVKLSDDNYDANWQTQNGIMAATYGAVGDGVTNNNDAFRAVRDAWKAVIRSNPAPNANSNKLGTLPAIYLAPGDYLITDPEVMMDSGFTTRTVGMAWVGSACGEVQILFQPETEGALFYNNDAIVSPTFYNINFNANDIDNAIFMHSVSSGGAQNAKFYNCQWTGIWKNEILLEGTNSNSEFYWHDTEHHGKREAALYSKDNDQFLNYHFNNSKVWNFEGKFIYMKKGGHVKVTCPDFSGYAPENVSYLYYLEGDNHSQGVCSFVEENGRYELLNDNARVMYCEWPQGNVTFNNSDASPSVTINPDAAETLTHEFQFGNTEGAVVTFRDCQLLGQHKYQSGNISWSFRKLVKYENCTNNNFRDFYDMFITSLTTGSNVAGLPVINIENCRGYQENYSFIDEWEATTVYQLDDVVRSDAWVYKCTTAGTSGSTQPTGAGVMSDGSVTWTQQDIFNTMTYIINSGVNSNIAGNLSSNEKIATLRNEAGQLPMRISASVPGAVRIILPPNVTVTNIVFSIPAGLMEQDTTGTYIVQTDEVSPTTFITASDILSDGLYEVFSGAYNTGASLQSRSILLQAQDDVEEVAPYPAICYIKYIG